MFFTKKRVNLTLKIEIFCDIVFLEKIWRGIMVSIQKQPLNNTMEKKRSGVINADVLKVIAIVTMLIDHVWQAGLVEPRLFNWIGRLAFPIFAFQIAEGYTKTSEVKRYALRLLAFAVASEIPFNIFCADWIFYPDYQNVIFTLLLGLCALVAVDKTKKEATSKNVSLCIIAVMVIVILADVLKVDYGASGVLTVIAFYLFRDFKCARILQFLSLLIIFTLLFPGNTFVVKIFGNACFLPVQIFALFSLIPIWLYNGKKGAYSKVLKYGFYAVYPLHLLVIYAVKRLCF